MNEYVIAGLGLLGLSIFSVTSLFALEPIADHFGDDLLTVFLIWALISGICLLFIIGGVPYVLLGWIIAYAALIVFGVYFKLKNK